MDECYAALASKWVFLPYLYLNEQPLWFCLYVHSFGLTVPTCYVLVVLSTCFYEWFKSNSCKLQLIHVRGRGLLAQPRVSQLPGCLHSTEHRAPVRPVASSYAPVLVALFKKEILSTVYAVQFQWSWCLAALSRRAAERLRSQPKNVCCLQLLSK